MASGYLASLSWAWHQLYRYFTWYHFDHGGHAYGGTQLLEVGYHGYQERVFMGAVQNLFYPPLEDFVMAGLQLLSGWTGFELYPIYVAVVLLLFLASQCSWVLTLRQGWTRVLFAAGLLWMFHLHKFDSSNLQGWSIFDAVVIGLSSQFLSGIGFFQLLRLAFLEEKPPKSKVLFWVGFCVLSHLVTGILAGLVYWVIAFERRWKRSDILHGVGVLIASTAFFTLPFLAYRNWMTSSTIFFNQSTWTFVLMATAAVVSIWQGWRGAIWLLLAALLYAPLILLPPLDSMVWLIPFHFYRLAMPAWILFWSGILLSADALPVSRWVRWSVMGAWVLAAVTLATQMRPWWSVPTGTLTLKPPLQVESYPDGWRKGTGGRTLVLGRTRSCDFGLDYILLGAFPGFSSIRGLHWEGSTGNTIISSYLVTLFGPPAVLDYYYLTPPDCGSFQRILKDALNVLDIGYLVYGEVDLGWIPEPKRSCWKQVLTTGLEGVPLVPVGNFEFQGDRRTILQVDQQLHSRAVYFNPQEAHFAIPTGKYPYFGGPVLGRMNGAVQGLYAAAPGLYPEEQEAFNRELLRLPEPQVRVGAPSVTSLGVGHYRMILPDSGAWVHLRIHPQPGMRVRDASGNEVPWMKAYPGVVFRGAGAVEVEVRRTPLMWISYAISGMFWVLFGVRRFRSSMDLV